MKKQTYLERRTAKLQGSPTADLQFEAEQNKLQVEQDLLATRRDLAHAEQLLENQLNASELDTPNIIETMSRIEARKKQVVILNELLTVLFPA